MIRMFSSPSSSLIGHCIGVESWVDLRTDVEIRTGEDQEGTNQLLNLNKKNKKKKKKKKEEFPPPLPWLARTGNLPSHMPWVLRRYYMGDGRLIIREEKVKHHEYFRAHRSNGRLVLQLIPLPDDVVLGGAGADQENGCVEADSDKGDDNNESNGDNDNDIDGDVDVDDDYDVKNGVDDSCDVENETHTDKDDQTVVDESSGELSSMENGISGKGGGGKCFEYNSIRTSPSCIFGMQVPSTIRPVRIAN